MWEGVTVVRRCEKCTCSMRALKKVYVPFGKGESCQ